VTRTAPHVRRARMSGGDEAAPAGSPKISSPCRPVLREWTRAAKSDVARAPRVWAHRARRGARRGSATWSFRFAPSVKRTFDRLSRYS